MKNKVYWGLGVLIVLFIGAFVLVMVNEHAENDQLEADAKKAQEQADRNKQQKHVTDTPPKVAIDNPIGPIAHHDEQNGEPIIPMPQNEPEVGVNQTPGSNLGDHAKLLETHPVKALRLQSEERGHWSAKWIPPFPPDDTEAAEIAKAVYIWVDYYIIKENSDDKDPRPPEIAHAEQVLYDLNERIYKEVASTRRADPRNNDLLKLRWARRDQPVNRAFIWPSTFDK